MNPECIVGVEMRAREIVSFPIVEDALKTHLFSRFLSKADCVLILRACPSPTHRTAATMMKNLRTFSHELLISELLFGTRLLDRPLYPSAN